MVLALLMVFSIPPVLADVEISESNLDFGDVEVGDVSEESFTIENDSARPIEDLNIDIDGDGSFEMDTDCSDTLDAGEDCGVDVRFEPETTGEYSGEVEVDWDGGSEDVDLTGVGVLED